MKLNDLVLENELNDIVFYLLSEHLNILSVEQLDESVNKDCKYKTGKIKQKDGSYKMTSGLDGITDTHIKKIKNKKMLDTLISRINARSTVLQNPTACKKAVIKKYMELNQEDDKKNFKNGDSCEITVFNKILTDIKKVIKIYITKAQKLGVKIDFKESFSADELLVAIPTLIKLNELNNNALDLSTFISESLNLMINNMNTLLNEGSECDIVKLSNYIVTLRGIKREISDLLSTSDNRHLNGAIKEFTTHYNKFNKN